MVLRRLMQAVGLGSVQDTDSRGGASHGEPTGQAVEHGGCVVQATPRKESGGWRVAGVIRPAGSAGDDPSPDADTVEHRYVRVDLYPTREAAAELAIAKGRQIIDEQGPRLFAAATNRKDS